MPGLVINPRARIFHGHDWVYASEVKKAFGNPQPGEVVSLKDFKDRPMGTAIYNPASQIVARRISRRKQGLDFEFFERRIRRALDYRGRIGGVDPRACRLVWSESDGLPGVIVDRYGDALVLQTLTLAMDRRKDVIAEALKAVLAPAAIIERNDSPIRAAEGLDPAFSVLHGEVPPPVTVPVPGAGFSLTADLAEGQKTGLYLDQFENYARVAPLAKGRRVLDCFANQGGFALACAAAGSGEAVAVDASEGAVEQGRANAARDGLGVEFACANAFDYLKDAEASGQKFGLVVLDPPSFTRNKKGLSGARRGYKEIHLRAMKLLDPGGILATFCCSHHVDHAEFRAIICDAAVDARATLRQIAEYRQRPDHPVIPTLPETEYLKGYAFELMGGW